LEWISRGGKLSSEQSINHQSGESVRRKEAKFERGVRHDVNDVARKEGNVP
jgi:hypothetical protein